MLEREPRKETIGKGELFFLNHPEKNDVFSGYGLTMVEDSKAHLVGLLLVDRPHPVDPAWLDKVEATFGQYDLVPMTSSGERGILCKMQIELDSIPYLRRFTDGNSSAIQEALTPLLDKLPNPIFPLSWDGESGTWRSQIPAADELPREINQVFERTGYGSLAVETNAGVIHACHAADHDIIGFTDKPVRYQWQLLKMPTAPLIRLEVTIVDNPLNPYHFESFLNVGQEDQARVLSQLAGQDQLYLAFYGENLRYRYTKVVKHDEQQWQYLDDLVMQAADYLDTIPRDQQDFDQAKAAFYQRSML